jgi:membrane protease YdiL (CAAX protease family)
VRAAYAPPARGGSVYLETFALFIFSFIVINLAAGPIEKAIGADPTPYLIWIVPFMALYPLARGVPWSRHRYAIGWHSGRGVVRELGAGVVGYLAGVPIVAAGIGLTFLLMMLANLLTPGEPAPPPSHPIMDKIGTGGWKGLLAIYLLASVWAPLTEESLFRGALYHHLRARLRPFFSALVVGLLFAIVHPQGFLAIPALASLGFVFSLMREWRGSLIAPMLAHGMHNGAIMTALWLALS